MEVVNLEAAISSGMKNPKIVQAYVGESPILILPQKDSGHSRMLEDFLKARSIVYETMPPPNNPQLPFHVPKLEGSNYRVVGMGMMSIDGQSKQCFGLGGFSIGYNIGIDKTHAKLVREHLESLGWKFF